MTASSPRRPFLQPLRGPARRPAIRAHAGFSLTELLVVIGIIVLLMGLLLVALGGVRDRARGASTRAVLQGFRQAAEAFQMEQRTYPGVVPESVLASSGALTSTESALLHLMGGYRVLPPPQDRTQQDIDQYADYTGDELNLGGGWMIKIDIDRLGEGPYIDGKPFGPYFSASGREVGITTGQELATLGVPDLIDAWGQPVLYARRLRTIGPLVGDANTAPRPQFTRAGLRGYLESKSLGELGQNQLADEGVGSILTLGDDESRDMMFAQAIRHPGFGLVGDPLDAAAQPRGAFVLISPGPDGVFFSRADGPGSTDALIGSSSLSTDDFLEAGPGIFEEFDDIRDFGGG